MTYDRGFYDTINAGSVLSAERVVPRIMNLIKPQTVLDVGCGEGAWASVFKAAGCSVRGIDGPHVDTSRLLVDPSEFRACRLDEESFSEGAFDLVVSLEVAEHLPASRADAFISDLCSHAPVVLFSAAIPGQGGVGHVNEQWPAYWAERFEDNGFEVSGALRWEFWDDDEVENWYRQNLLLCIADGMLMMSDSGRLQEFVDSPMSRPWPVVHPVLHDHLRSIR